MWRRRVAAWSMAAVWILCTPRGAIRDQAGVVRFPTEESCQEIARYLNAQATGEPATWALRYRWPYRVWFVCEEWPDG